MPYLMTDKKYHVLIGRDLVDQLGASADLVGVIRHGEGGAVFHDGDIAFVAVAAQGLGGAVGDRPHSVELVIEADDMAGDDFREGFGACDVDHVVVVFRMEGGDTGDRELFSKALREGTFRKRAVHVEDIRLFALEPLLEREIEFWRRNGIFRNVHLDGRGSQYIV